MQLFEYIDMLSQPYDIFYSKSTYSQLHWHYYSEIIYMEKGSVKVVCNDSSTILKEGDLCYFYPLQLHEITKAEDNDVVYAVIKFDIHSINIPPSYISKIYDYFVRRTREDDFCLLLKNDNANNLLLKTRIDNIVNEYLNKDEFYMLSIQSEIHDLLITIARNVNKNISIFQKKGNDNSFSFFHILEYIDTHSGEQLEIKELARMCNMSYSNFARMFRQNYGRSCKEYINYIRLNKAHDLLVNTDYDLNYIATETGFFDCSHFIRTYKKWRGITPKQARIKEKSL
ncbi:MAG: AraC family transcriptional regulator [Lachnospira sp.]